ncbi:hypothetical protein BN871_AI_00320 [Paenibacillus sp. P22]|nr:hypothetical protein BN871_AI_00320 [Paenibacillus sp. P22]
MRSGQRILLPVLTLPQQALQVHIDLPGDGSLRIRHAFRHDAQLVLRSRHGGYAEQLRRLDEVGVLHGGKHVLDQGCRLIQPVAVGHVHIDDRERVVPRIVGHLRDRSIRDDMDFAGPALQPRRTQTDQLHGAFIGSRLDDVSDSELVLQDDEESGDDVLHQTLGAEADGQAKHACAGEQRADLDAHQGQHKHRRNEIHHIRSDILHQPADRDDTARLQRHFGLPLQDPIDRLVDNQDDKPADQQDQGDLDQDNPRIDPECRGELLLHRREELIRFFCRLIGRRGESSFIIGACRIFHRSVRQIGVHLYLSFHPAERRQPPLPGMSVQRDKAPLEGRLAKIPSILASHPIHACRPVQAIPPPGSGIAWSAEIAGLMTARLLPHLVVAVLRLAEDAPDVDGLLGDDLSHLRQLPIGKVDGQRAAGGNLLGRRANIDFDVCVLQQHFSPQRLLRGIEGDQHDFARLLTYPLRWQAPLAELVQIGWMVQV